MVVLGKKKKYFFSFVSERVVLILSHVTFSANTLIIAKCVQYGFSQLLRAMTFYLDICGLLAGIKTEFESVGYSRILSFVENKTGIFQILKSVFAC